MNMFVPGSANLPVATQILFTNAICFVFFVSAILSIPAIIVSAMRGNETMNHQKGRPDNSKGEYGRLSARYEIEGESLANRHS